MLASKKVLLNTCILYARMIITIGITLYTTRIVLQALGATDFGIFNLIAGVVAMLSFISNAMATTTQRFLSFYQGKKDVIMQKKVFSNSLLIHLYIGIFLVIVLQLAALFLFKDVLNIPQERLDAAQLVYLFTSISIFFTIVGGPYEGSLIAHENMLMVAVLNIVDAVSKLVVALILLNLNSDKLIFYGLSMATISFILFLCRVIYCKIYYQESVVLPKFKLDKLIAKDLTSFAGWNLLGALCSLGKTQGVAILLNIFYGSRMNASYGIANQVSGQLNFFSNTMLRALNPQIMKSEGEDNRERMIRLSFIACKFSFILLAIFAIPSVFQIDLLLKYWLKDVPKYSSDICSLILIALMVNQLTIGIDSAVQATGRIRKYMIVVGAAKLLIVPIGYLLLKSSFGIFSVFYAYILLEGLGGAFRLFIINELTGIKFHSYFENVILPIVIPVGCTIFINIMLKSLMITHSINILIVYLLSFCVTVLGVYFFGLSKSEKDLIFKFLSGVKSKFK